MKIFSLFLLTIFLWKLNGLEIDIEGREEFCAKFTFKEIEGSISIDALCSGFNSKLVAYKILNENDEIVTEQRKLEEFHYVINNTKMNETYKLCIKDMDGTKKTVFFNKLEHATISNKPLHKDSFENLRHAVSDLLDKLRKIDQGIRFRENLAANHIELTTKNLNNIKYGSLGKLLIVALITVVEILILMKFIEKKERVYIKPK